MKAFLSDETAIQSKIALPDKNLPLTRDKKAAATLKILFAEVIENLIIPYYENCSLMMIQVPT